MIRRQRSHTLLVLIGFVTLSGESLAADRLSPELWTAAGAAPAKRSVPAPAFALRDLNDRSVSLQAFRGRVVMLYFWATW